VRELRARVQELEHQIADLERHNKELREAVAALLVPDPVAKKGNYPGSRYPG
jgi:hypothetical protein